MNRMKRFLIGLAFAVGIGTPALALAPGTVSDLAATAPSIAPQLHTKLTWTSPTNTPTSYDIRYRTDATCTDVNFGTATAVTYLANNATGAGGLVATEPAPKASGQQETMVMIGLKPNTTYFWCLQASNGDGTSLTSNSPSRATAKYEGYGYATVGGGEKTFCEVSNTSDTGAGSFRNCLAANRYVVFSTSGVITMLNTINMNGFNNITIDGFTSTDPGVTLQSCGPGGTACTGGTNADGSLNDGLRLRDQDNVILAGFRIQGLYAGTGTANNGDTLTTNASASGTVVSNMVWSHLTIRNVDDAAMDLYNRVTDATIVDCFVFHNFHSMTTGNFSPSNRISIHHNVFAQNGSRQPQLTGQRRDIDIRYNVYYRWAYSDSGGYGIRIRNVTAGDVTANIIGNVFLSIGGPRDDSAIVYGSGPGWNSEEGANYSGCKKQDTLYTGGTMGALYVASNILPSTACDGYKTVSSEVTVPANAAITAEPDITTLQSVILARGPGMNYPDLTESSLQTAALTTASINSTTAYHVRTDGSDANCSGRVDAADPGSGSLPRACAFSTPQKAWDVMVLGTGEQIVIHAGTWTTTTSCNVGSFTSSAVLLCAKTSNGSAKSFTTYASIEAGIGETVILEGNGTASAGVDVINISNLTVKGIHVRNVTGTSTTGLAFSCVAFCAAGSGADALNVTFDGIFVDGIDAPCSTPGQGAEVGFYNNGGRTTGGTLKNSYVQGGRCQALITAQTNSTSNGAGAYHFDNNELVSVTGPSSRAGGLTAIWMKSMNGPNTINGNYFHLAGGAMDTAIFTRSAVGINMVNNIFENTGGGQAIEIFQDSSDQPASSDKIEYDVITNNVFIGPHGVAAIFGQGGSCDGCDVSNNFFQNVGTAVRWNNACNDATTDCSSGTCLTGQPAPASSTHDNNQFDSVAVQYNVGTGCVVGPAQFIGTPGFTDAITVKPSPYFAPTIGSSLIDRGKNSACGHTILGTNCEIGAYEFAPPPSNFIANGGFEDQSNTNWTLTSGVIQSPKAKLCSASIQPQVGCTFSATSMGAECVGLTLPGGFAPVCNPQNGLCTSACANDTSCTTAGVGGLCSSAFVGQWNTATANTGPTIRRVDAGFGPNFTQIDTHSGYNLLECNQIAAADCASAPTLSLSDTCTYRMSGFYTNPTNIIDMKLSIKVGGTEVCSVAAPASSVQANAPLGTALTTMNNWVALPASCTFTPGVPGTSTLLLTFVNTGGAPSMNEFFFDDIAITLVSCP